MTSETKFCRNFIDPTCDWKYCMSGTATNAVVSTFQKLQGVIVQYYKASSDSGFLCFLFTFSHTVLSDGTICFQNWVT